MPLGSIIGHHNFLVDCGILEYHFFVYVVLRIQLLLIQNIDKNLLGTWDFKLIGTLIFFIDVSKNLSWRSDANFFKSVQLSLIISIFYTASYVFEKVFRGIHFMFDLSNPTALTFEVLLSICKCFIKLSACYFQFLNFYHIRFDLVLEFTVFL